MKKILLVLLLGSLLVGCKKEEIVLKYPKENIEITSRKEIEDKENNEKIKNYLNKLDDKFLVEEDKFFYENKRVYRIIVMKEIQNGTDYEFVYNNFKKINDEDLYLYFQKNIDGKITEKTIKTYKEEKKEQEKQRKEMEDYIASLKDFGVKYKNEKIYFNNKLVSGILDDQVLNAGWFFIYDNKDTIYIKVNRDESGKVLSVEETSKIVNNK